MFNNKIEDWKDCLREDEKETLQKLLDGTKKFKCAFSKADDVKVAQLWCALLEIKREIDEIKGMLAKVEEPFKTIVEIGDMEKRRVIERIVSEIIKGYDKETQEATQKLVDSLMKF